MVNTQTIMLSSITNISLSAVAPFQLSFSCAAPSLSAASIYRIDYNFGDGTGQSIKSNIDHLGNMYLPSIVTKQYNLTDTYSKTINITASVYSITISQPTIYNITLNLSVPVLEGTSNSMFNSIHLNSVKMFNTSDDILYLFETVNPRYLLPVLVNWNSRPVKNSINISSFYRPYRLLAPFENEQTTSIGIGGNIQS